MEVRKQIGNAVAPVAGKVLLEGVVMSLRETDARVEEREMVAAARGMSGGGGGVGGVRGAEGEMVDLTRE